MTAVELHDVTVANRRQGPSRLERVNLTVPDGEMLTVLGPAGAGKSAIVRAITGLDDPTEGEVLFDDVNVNALSSRDRDVAVVMQDFPLLAHRDGRANVEFAAKLRRFQDRDDIDVSTEAVIDELGLARVTGLRPHEMDPAERQRVALGRALVREANAYVFDEPFSAQDPRMRGHIRSTVAAWQRHRARTTIIMTSDPIEAMAIGAPIMVLHQGIVHQTGSSRHIHHEPANVFVAAMFGAEPINLMAGRLRGGELQLPLGSVAVAPAAASERRDGDTIIVGVRPSDLQRTAPDGRSSQGGMRLAGAVGEVQWQGDYQRVLLGFEIDEESEALFAEIETAVQFTMFQPYVTARVAAGDDIAADDQIGFYAPAESVMFFDPLSGDRLA